MHRLGFKQKLHVLVHPIVVVFFISMIIQHDSVNFKGYKGLSIVNSNAKNLFYGLKTCAPQDTAHTRSFFVTDDFPLTNDILKEHGIKEKKGIRSYDKAWLINMELNQVLVVELATDYHRFFTFLFTKDYVPKDLIKHIELNTENGDIASEQQKEDVLNDFILSSKKINSSFFKTKKGFAIGDKKEKALKVYGDPDKIVIEDHIEKYEWKFAGDQFLDDKTASKNKRTAKNSFGHTVIMYFKDSNLIGLILFNDIP